MTIAQKAKQYLAELKEVYDLINSYEFEVKQFEITMDYFKRTNTEPDENFIKNLKESKHLLNISIDRWNELTNAKLTKVTE